MSSARNFLESIAQQVEDMRTWSDDELGQVESQLRMIDDRVPSDREALEEADTGQFNVETDAQVIERWALLGPDDELIAGPSFGTREEAIEAAKVAGPKFAVAKNSWQWKTLELAWAPEWEQQRG